jgi:hypothetical protein
MTYQPPMPTAPIPVAPLQWPAPPPQRRGRPGIITAIGIMSIIVACIALMANLIITFMSFGMLVGSRTPRMLTPPMPPPALNSGAAAPNGATAIVGGIQIDPSESEDGVHDESLRLLVISGMVRARQLDEGRTKQLDLLLMVAGRSIFPFISPATAPQTIRANVSDSGRLPSASAGKKGPDYFIVGTGRVEVYDTHAIFRPDGSPNVVSVTAPTDDASVKNDPNASPADPGLPPPGTPQPIPAPAPPPMTPMPNPMASINPTAATLSMIEGILSGMLAIYLLIIGIMTLRDSRSGGKLHWVYVALKIPLVVLAVIANSLLASSFITGLQATAAAAAANSPSGSPPAAQTAAAGLGAAATFWIILLTAAAIAYPLSLIFVLLTKTVRRYYGPARDY